MLIYKNLQDFMDAFNKTTDKTIYMMENKIQSENLLIGEIIIQFYHDNIFHVLKYREEITPVTLLTQATFDAIKEYFDEETMKKTMEKYNTKLAQLDEQIEKQKTIAKEALTKSGCENIIEGIVVEGG